MGTSAVEECMTANEWGPVRRGFAVWLPDGRRGTVYDIRRGGGGGVEFVVATGLFLRTLVTVRPPEIEAILPRLRRIVVGEADVAEGYGPAAAFASCSASNSGGSTPAIR